MSQIRRFFTEGIGTLLHQRAWDSSERALKEYYENQTRPSLSKDLVDALGKLNGDTDHDHPRRIFQQHAIAKDDCLLQWDEDCFKKWIIALERPAPLSAFLPTLWRVFVYFAGYPWMENMPTYPERLGSHRQHIDEDGFILAYNLLPLRGVELVGNIEKSWAAKYPRFASLMFNSIGTFSVAEEEQSEGFNNESWIEIMEKQLIDAITLTRPEPYISVVAHGEDMKQVARRLLLSAEPCQEMGYPRALSSLDLQTLLQLFLLLRINNTPWRRSLICYTNVKRCGDIEKPFFVHDDETVSHSVRLAKALIQHTLGDAQSISWKSFKEFCSAYPNILLRFYELWTSICLSDPLESPTPDLFHRLPNSIAQTLSLIGPVDFDSLVPGGSPFNEDERQLQLDMQNAIQVFDTTFTPGPDVGKLVERLSKADLFHILVISTTRESIDKGSASPSVADSSEHLFTLFTSTSGKEIMLEGTPGCTNYSWRYGSVQLLPKISCSGTGGLAASFVDGTTFMLSPHNQRDSESRHDSRSFTVDLKNVTMVVEKTGSPLLQLKLDCLKCFQMPGAAATFTKSSDTLILIHK
ncbi:hypothetical protein IFR05_000270 [Cadophora sp. M221]|nr:hypothetical protein IFR05_000270 [Cadophora sp. M221]